MLQTTRIAVVCLATLISFEQVNAYSTERPLQVRDSSLESRDSTFELNTLAQKASSTSSLTVSTKKSKKVNDDPWGIGGFCLGCVLIPFALVLLWKNEKKVVTFAKCMDQGRESVRSVDAEDPNDENEFELVHLTGKTVNLVEIADNDFGVIAHDSYRLKRKVEMYQWRENVHEKDGHKTYTYEGCWSEHKIDSRQFSLADEHQNPDNDWPFTSHSFEASNVTLGKFRLRPDQILRLGRGQTQKVTLEEEGANAVQFSRSAMDKAGFAPFQIRGIYLVSSTKDNSEEAPHIGQYRVTFEYDMCGPCTIIAQQVLNEEGQTTFRKWNPEKISVPYGQSTDADNQLSSGNPLCCYICMCVDCCCEALFEEVVDLAVDTKMTADTYFDDQAKNIQTAARIIRPSGVLATIFGFFLLFSPVIALLKWIPLVGQLLGAVASIAAFLFALVVGSVLSCLVIAIAWVFYRPLIGVSLLVLTGLGVYFIFFFGNGEEDAFDDQTTPSESQSEADTTQDASTTGEIGSSEESGVVEPSQLIQVASILLNHPRL